MKCFLDMDGVLVDFVGAMCRVHNQKWPYNEGDNKNIDLETIWDMPAKEFWAPADTIEFWADIKAYETGQDLVDCAIKTYGIDNVSVLTSAPLSPESAAGKIICLQRNYPKLARRFLIATKYTKKLCAEPNAVLVDDRIKIIREFQENDGIGVLYPQPWNDP